MGLLDRLNMKEQVASKEAYRKVLSKLQLELLHMQRRLQESQRSVILVFEGPDAAGKGGIIKRVTEKLDPRLIRVYSVAKPTPEEHRHHYLWRFWNKLPGHGEMAIFDRSWYGRVLVERVEKFAKNEEWKRAYREIIEFERQLVGDRVLILKFYLHISKDEQLRRFHEREADPYKHWKITPEDWRNRLKWKPHNRAAEEMFRKTSWRMAPWRIVSGQYKWYARIEVLRHLVREMRKFFSDQSR